MASTQLLHNSRVRKRLSPNSGEDRTLPGYSAALVDAPTDDLTTGAKLRKQKHLTLELLSSRCRGALVIHRVIVHPLCTKCAPLNVSPHPTVT